MQEKETMVITNEEQMKTGKDENDGVCDKEGEPDSNK